MFITIARPAVEPMGPDAIAVPGAPTIPALTPRALHARLLDNAAARRRRGLERHQAQRPDDAAYWMSAAPMAINKARELRATAALAYLP